jgi:hypothetical protein
LLQNEQACCTIQEQYDLPLYEACREELEFLLGQAGYAQLDAHYRALAK